MSESFDLIYKRQNGSECRMSFRASRNSAVSLGREHARNLYHSTGVSQFEVVSSDGRFSSQITLTNEELLVPVQHE